MKVLLTTDTVGGVWTYALELSRALARHDVQIALATMGAPLSPSQRADASRLPNVTLFESAYKLEWMQDPWDDVRQAGDWLLDIERQFSPDLIHLNGYAHGALPWQAPVVVVAHSCVLSWWQAVKGTDAPPSWNRYRDQVTRGLRAADVVVAPSREMLQAAEHHYGPFRQSRVIYNARSPELFSAPTAKELFVFTAGRVWDEAKNLSALTAIAPQLPWPAYVAGEDTHPDGRRAATENVRMLGKLNPDDLAPWFSRAAIYALPARYEPFGLTILEAALSGCALVLGDIPSLREIWNDAATFVPPDNANALARAIGLLAADPLKRATMAARAQTRAAEFSPDRMAREYLDLYLEMIDFPNRRTDHLSDQSNPREHDRSDLLEHPSSCAS
jgi:glycosyltransferase involved in cell wall biosynthesis